MRRRLARPLKWLVPLAAAIYLGTALTTGDLPNAVSSLPAKAFAIAAAASIAVALAFYLLALAWGRTLVRQATGDVALSGAVRAYAITTFAKYLPGSIFHFVGRQVAAKRIGCSQLAAAQATAVEIVGHLVVTASLIALLLPFAGGVPWVEALPPPLAKHWPLVALATAALIGSLSLAARGKWPRPAWLDWRTLCLVGLCQTGFFLIYTALGTWLALVVLAAPTQLAPVCALAYLLAWLVGFLTPGAPGGLGVREACLLLLLAPYGEPATILAFAALCRISLMIGEALFALSGFAQVHRPARAPESDLATLDPVQDKGLA